MMKKYIKPKFNNFAQLNKTAHGVCTAVGQLADNFGGPSCTSNGSSAVMGYCISGAAHMGCQTGGTPTATCQSGTTVGNV